MIKLKCAPPLITGGFVAARIYTRLMDHRNCHSCGIDLMDRGSRSIGTVFKEENREAKLEFAKLCVDCAGPIEDAISGLGRAWEE